jgi:hypothetical protein
VGQPLADGVDVPGGDAQARGSLSLMWAPICHASVGTGRGACREWETPSYMTLPDWEEFTARRQSRMLASTGVGNSLDSIAMSDIVALVGERPGTSVEGGSDVRTG